MAYIASSYSESAVRWWKDPSTPLKTSSRQMRSCFWASLSRESCMSTSHPCARTVDAYHACSNASSLIGLVARCRVALASAFQSGASPRTLMGLSPLAERVFSVRMPSITSCTLRASSSWAVAMLAAMRFQTPVVLVLVMGAPLWASVDAVDSPSDSKSSSSTSSASSSASWSAASSAASSASSSSSASSLPEAVAWCRLSVPNASERPCIVTVASGESDLSGWWRRARRLYAAFTASQEAPSGTSSRDRASASRITLRTGWTHNACLVSGGITKWSRG